MVLKLQGTVCKYSHNRVLAVVLLSGIRLDMEMRLLDVIENDSEKQSEVWNKYDKVISDLVKAISNKEYDCFSHNDDYLKKRCGIDDFMDQELVSDLAFYLTGLEDSSQEKRMTLEHLDYIDEHMGHGYYLGFSPSSDSLNTIIQSLEGKEQEVALKSIGEDHRKGSLFRLCKELDSKGEDEQIREINSYNDGSYVKVWSPVEALAWILSRKEEWKLFLNLLLTIEYIPLQGALISIGLHTVEDVFSVISLASMESVPKPLQYLLREHCYHLLAEVPCHLSELIEDENSSEVIKQLASDVLNQYESEKEKRLDALTDFWVNGLGKEECVVWLSQKRNIAERNIDIARKSQQKELTRIISGKLSLSQQDIDSFDLEDKDFHSLLSISKSVKTKESAARIIDAIARCLFSEGVYLSTTVDGVMLENLRSLYICLNKSGKNGMIILNRYRKPLEGFAVVLERSIHAIRQEAYWLSMLLLSIEESRDESKFDEYVHALFRDTYLSINSFSDDVFPPYIIAESIVSQVLVNKKDAFELKMLEEISDLVFIIRVFTANEGVFSDVVATAFCERLKAEWPTARKLLLQRRGGNVAFFDSFLSPILRLQEEQ